MAIHAYSKAKQGGVKVTENFRVREFACKDGSDPVFIDTTLVNILQAIRYHFDAPVTVNSGYRTPAYNKKVSGATYSQHLYGKAADIAVRGVKPAEVAAYAETLLPKSGGIGVYTNFVHIDTRESRSRWKG